MANFGIKIILDKNKNAISLKKYHSGKKYRTINKQSTTETENELGGIMEQTFLTEQNLCRQRSLKRLLVV